VKFLFTVRQPAQNDAASLQCLLVSFVLKTLLLKRHGSGDSTGGDLLLNILWRRPFSRLRRENALPVNELYGQFFRHYFNLLSPEKKS
jgi:hypothetical protein